MTDDLIALLREKYTTELEQEAADALEAQARRIAELEADCAILRAANFGQSQTIDGYAARIAELEAALKPMTAVVEFLLPFGDLSDEERAQWGKIIRAARAALGEER